MRIRDAEGADWTAIWPFFAEIVAAGETYSYPREMSFEDGRDLWMLRPPGRTVVAVNDAETVLGTAKMNPNQLGGGGAHVASASFMVAPAASGQGVGRALGEEAVAWARGAGYRAMQFNAVVETNAAAVRLWQGLGFEVVGTVPEAFRRPSGDYVGLHVMYRRL